MPEYLAPAVYLEEVEFGAAPIEGVSTSTAGMVGVTERGPVDVPILITGIAGFRRWFGDLLDETEFTGPTGPHCHLPSAVEGFFTNAGRRVYVTRVASPGAARADAQLFDRGSAGGADTALLRTAARGTGTSVGLPLVAALDAAAVAAGEWVRIGDGSAAEYRRVVTVGDTTAVPLAMPLARAHDATDPIAQFTRDPQPADAQPAEALRDDAFAGDDTVVVSGTAIGFDANFPFEIGTRPHAEHRFARNITDDGTDTTVQLDAPLDADHPNGTDVRQLDVSGAPDATAHLASPVRAGEALLFGDALGGDFDDPATVVIVGAGPTREVRRIGGLTRLELRHPLVEPYPRGTSVRQGHADDDVRDVRPGSGVDALVLDDVDGLAPGQRLVVDPTGTPVTTTVRSVDTAATSVTLAAPLAAAPATGTDVGMRPAVLTGEAAAGATTLALDDRVGLERGDVLAVGDGLEREYLTIAERLGEAGPPPDAGTVVLTTTTAVRHAAGALVRRQTVGFATGAHHTVALALAASAGSDDVFVTDDDGFGTGDVVAVVTPDGVLRVLELADANAPAPRDIELDTPLERNHSAGAALVERAPVLRVEALDVGGWGNRLRIAVQDEPAPLVTGARLVDLLPPNEIRLSSPTGVEPGTVLELGDPADGTPIGPLLKVVTVDRQTGRIRLAAALSPAQVNQQNAAAAAGTGLQVRSRELRMTVMLLRRPDPTMPARDDAPVSTEDFLRLSMDPRHSRYVVTMLGDVNGPPNVEDRRPQGGSWYVRVEDLAATQAAREAIRLGPEALVDVLPSGRPRPARRALAGGDDAIALLTDAAYIGADAVDPEDRTGLFSLAGVDEISIVAVPGRTGAELQTAVINHCEELRYRFAVLDARPAPDDSIAGVQAQRQQFDTTRAALYHPWLLVPRPYPGGPGTLPTTAIPPSGHVLGVYARTDVGRGVHKAPANELVRGALGLTRTLNLSEQDILNPYPVNTNVIRDFRLRNRGIRVWGGRVMTSDSARKYVNVVRLLIFIEASLERGLQWVVFEPNAEPLWARVRQAVSNFLTVVWRNGALEGTKVEEAYFVKCDRTTMTQTDIDSGRLIVLIGVAPVKPAEFVIVRIGLWTAHADS